MRVPRRRWQGKDRLAPSWSRNVLTRGRGARMGCFRFFRDAVQEETEMMKFNKTVGVAWAAGMLLAGLSACQKPEGPAEKAGKQVDKAVEQAGQQIEKAGENIRDAAKGDGK